jgi:aldehyde:ferredoxin oxidoreductase
LEKELARRRIAAYLLRRGFSPEAEATLFSLATGVEMDVKAMMKAGERIRNLERAIMVREGRRREDDTLADYCFTVSEKGEVPGPDGHWIEINRAIDREKWEKLKDAYYHERGWDPVTGIPTRARPSLRLTASPAAVRLWRCGSTRMMPCL